MGRSNVLPFIPPEAASGTLNYDLLYLVLTLNAVFFTTAIFIAIVYFVVKYRRGSKADRSNPPLYNLPIEIAWTGIPLIIALGLFVWASVLYLANQRVPPGAMEVYVVGKQWMWKLQHPEGRWENNELHVPVGRPIQLVMTSEDVIHSFFIPEFRLKQDVIPGQYTRMWFTPTKTGVYHLFCAEFCGAFHSQMTGTVTVMEPAEYEKWLRGGTGQESLAATGQRLFIQHGCDGCHGPASSVRAPSLAGIYGQPVAVQIPQSGVPLENIEATTLIADSRYIHDAIVLPEKEIAAGYKPIMPTFKDQLTEEQIFQIAAYLKSLTNGDAPNYNSPPGRTTSLTAEEYRARTGFTPANMKNVTPGSGGTPATSGAGGPAGRGNGSAAGGGTRPAGAGPAGGTGPASGSPTGVPSGAGAPGPSNTNLRPGTTPPAGATAPGNR